MLISFPGGLKIQQVEDQGKSCRSCGCSWLRACHDEVTGHGCHWVEDDLCCVCARREDWRLDPSRPGLLVSADGRRHLALTAMGWFICRLEGKGGAPEIILLDGPFMDCCLAGATPELERQAIEASQKAASLRGTP